MDPLHLEVKRGGLGERYEPDGRRGAMNYVKSIKQSLVTRARSWSSVATYQKLGRAKNATYRWAVELSSRGRQRRQRWRRCRRGAGSSTVVCLWNASNQKARWSSKEASSNERRPSATMDGERGSGEKGGGRRREGASFETFMAVLLVLVATGSGRLALPQTWGHQTKSIRFCPDKESEKAVEPIRPPEGSPWL